MRHLRDDVRFGFRLLAASPWVSLCAVLSLAIGVGGTVAAVSLAEGLLLHPLPAVPAIGRLVAAAGVHVDRPERSWWLSYADYRDYAAGQRAVRGLAAAAECDVSFASRGPAERVSGLAVSGSYFDVLQLRPAAGRLLSRADQAAPVVVLGYGLWQRAFGRDSRTIGATVTVNGRSATVVGVAPRGFAGTDLVTRREVWLPLGVYRQFAAGVLAPFSGRDDRKQEWLQAVGRLAPDTSLAQARAAFAVTARRLASAFPATNARRSVRLIALRDAALGSSAQSRSQVVGFVGRSMAVAGIVLAVAAFDVAGLLLARGLARRREIAVRLSLGAGRGRILQQLLVEGLTLASLGAAGGAALGGAGVALLPHLRLPVTLAVQDFRLSGMALGWALLLGCATCTLFALIPALQAFRLEVVPALRGAAPRGGRRGRGLGEALVSLQVAAAFVVLLAAGLLLRTLVHLWAIPPGFDPSHVLAATVDLSAARYGEPRVAAFYGDLLERLRHVPGVLDASMVSALPIMGADLEVDLGVSRVAGAAKDGAHADNAAKDGAHADNAAKDGASAGTAADEPEPAVRHVLVGSRFFPTVGIRVVRGRDFTTADGPAAPGVVMVNEAAARELWPGRDPLGRALRLAQTPAPFTVVGVVSNATYASLREERRPMLYLAHAQSARSFIGKLLAPQMTLLLRTRGEPRRLLPAVREQVRELDPRLPVFGAAALRDLLDAATGIERQASTLYGGLALVAVALAMLGLFGVLTRAVEARIREIGIRMACGATPAAVRRLVVGRSAILTLAGLTLGALAGLPATDLLQGQLFGVAAHDPAAWALAASVLLVLALSVSVLPAQRAAAVDPVQSMRHE